MDMRDGHDTNRIISMSCYTAQITATLAVAGIFAVILKAFCQHFHGHFEGI